VEVEGKPKQPSLVRLRLGPRAGLWRRHPQAERRRREPPRPPPDGGSL